MPIKLFLFIKRKCVIILNIGELKNMGKRFLNTKTKEVYLEENMGNKCNEILNKYLPYQKVLIVTSEQFKKENLNYYNEFLKSLKTANLEYVFESKISINKHSTANLLKKVDEDIACIIAVGNGALIELIKIVAYIKEIPYIIVPVKQFEPQFFTTVAKMKVDGIMKFYRVNSPLAVLVEKELLLKQKRADIIYTFSRIMSVSMQLLDEFLIGICKQQTLPSKHYSALKNILYDTLSLKNELYNYSESAIVTLINNGLKMGLILQSYNLYNIDAARLSTTASFKLDSNHKIPFFYYQMIESLFLVELYESFILNLKLNNFFTANVKERLKISGSLFSEKLVKTNIIKNMENCELLKLNCYQLKEYETEILKEIRGTKELLKEAYTMLKRMNLAFSYYVEKALDIDTVKKSICLAPDLSCTDNFLKIMFQFGVLDYQF